MKLHDHGVYLVNGVPQTTAPAGMTEAEAKKGTIAYGILKAHNTSDSMQDLRMKFDSMTSHDITYVGIIQTARASGMKEFPLPYVMTNCHNSLCAVGGTINEDDHQFALSAAHKYGGIYVPPNMAVIHSYNREMMSGCGRMILGSDSHTRYGALGTMAVGEGGGELAKQLVGRTYDMAYPGVVAIYLTGKPNPGVGPHDVALALVAATYANGYVKNKVMEFVGPGVANLSADYRNGIDVMTTETTCWSSIWQTDDVTKQYFEQHNRPEAYKELKPADVAYYDGCIELDLSTVECMIALPMHPSYAYPIRELKANAGEILQAAQDQANKQLGGKVEMDLVGKICADGRIYVDQGVVAGCSGGTYENICAVADIIKGMPYSSIAREYLLSEGIPSDRVIKTGSPMYEVLNRYLPQINASSILENLGLEKGKYFVVSAHREENISSERNFGNLVKILNDIAQTYGFPVIVSTHPRTRKKIETDGVEFQSLIRLMKPMGFSDYNKLQINAKTVISDSGTISEEASILNFYCSRIRRHSSPFSASRIR